jgi:hypothetical protein
MSNQPPADAHSEEQAQAAHVETPKVLDLCDHTNAPSIHRQSPVATHEASEATMLAPAVQRTSPTLLEKAAAVRSLKGKEKEWTAVAEKKRPLQLLDLPVDILKEIIEKVGPMRLIMAGGILTDTAPAYQ